MALLLARLLLAAVFIVAGLTKLTDLNGSRQALRDFGLPAQLATPFSLLLPLAELAVAVALVPTFTAWWAALGALFLLLLFVAGIGYNLARGRQPECHCFGQLHSAPAGWPTLIRNLVLAAVAGFVVGFGRMTGMLSPIEWLGVWTVVQRIELLIGLVLLGLLALEGWLLWQIIQQQGRLLLRIEALEAQSAHTGLAHQSTPAQGLPVGSPAPTFQLAALSSSNEQAETITLETLRARGKPVMLLFSDPGCGPCTALLPEIGRWQRDYAGKLMLTLISRGTPEANRSKTNEHGITQVLLQQDREVAQAYQAYGTPSAVLIRPDSVIGSSLVQGADAIRALVAQAVGLPALHPLPMAPSMNGNAGGSAPSQSSGLKIGESAPDFALPDLGSKTIHLTDFRGKKTLLLFWNPDCRFCQKMLADLKTWETHRPKGAPELLIISTGTIEANKALDLRSPILLDEGMSIGRLFGAQGTPMAVLIEANSTIASQAAAGAEAVLALANAPQELSQPASA